jgi:hypothetical protein
MDPLPRLDGDARCSDILAVANQPGAGADSPHSHFVSHWNRIERLNPLTVDLQLRPFRQRHTRDSYVILRMEMDRRIPRSGWRRNFN